MPRLNLIEPREAVQRVREALGCTAEEAVRFLSDRWLSGEVEPIFIGDKPPGGRSDPTMADWFAGAIATPDKWLPRRAISEPGEDPEWQRIPGRSFPFRFDRREFEALLTRARQNGRRGNRIASRSPGPARRDSSQKPDPRDKSVTMIGGLEKALASGALVEGRRATLKAAYDAMLAALGHKSAPNGMGDDAFAKHCKPWLKQHGIYD
jgi:hypothetical protein